jgi:hypothetical protein
MTSIGPIIVTIRPIPMKTKIPYHWVPCASVRPWIDAFRSCGRGTQGHPIPRLLVSILLLFGLHPSAQPIYTVNNGDLNFLDANKVHKVGPLGESAGNKTLYRNVMISEGKAVDCIVTTESITNGSFSQPPSPCPNTIPFDYKEPSNCPAGTLRDNQDRFFSPMMIFGTGGGNVKFKFEFIVGGSYNDGTGKGKPVILKNVMVNSYDIDGTTGCHIPDATKNQYNDFSGFNAAARSTPGSKIFPTYNSGTGHTRFMSTSNCNVHNVTDPSTRIRVEYDFIQEFEVVMGMTGPGNAFYMLDFGPGPYWIPEYLGGAVLNLNTSTESYNNSGAFCTVPVKISSGEGNIASSNNAINELFMAFASSDILDGNNEFLTTDMNNPTAHIRLGAPFSGSQTFSVSGIVYRAERMENSGYRTIKIVRNDGNTMTSAQTESLLDAFSYYNTVNTAGIRRFRIWFREGTYTSTFGFFELYGGCMILKARALDFDAVQEKSYVRIEWRTEDLQDIVGYSLERSIDGNTWLEVARFTVEKNNGAYNMRHFDRPATGGIHQYRLVERYTDGRFGHSPVRSVNFRESPGTLKPHPNPVTDGILHLLLEKDGEVTVVDQSNRRVMHNHLKAGRHRIELGTLPKGVYILKADGRAHRILLR